MTNIDFYILQDTASEARWQFACRLVEKITRMGHKILVTMDNPAEANALDELLWTFKPESFIAHQYVSNDSRSSTTPVVITTDIQEDRYLGDNHDVLINLSSEIPAYFSRFSRMSEIVIQEANILKITRNHYSFFRERGYPIQHRQM